MRLIISEVFWLSLYIKEKIKNTLSAVFLSRSILEKHNHFNLFTSNIYLFSGRLYKTWTQNMLKYFISRQQKNAYPRITKQERNTEDKSSWYNRQNQPQWVTAPAKWTLTPQCNLDFWDMNLSVVTGTTSHGALYFCEV